MNHWRIICLTATLLASMHVVFADPVTLPHTFKAGDKAVADQVNANFATLQQASNAQDARIKEMESNLNKVLTELDQAKQTIQTLQNELASATTNIGLLQTNLTDAYTAIGLLQYQQGKTDEAINLLAQDTELLQQGHDQQQGAIDEINANPSLSLGHYVNVDTQSDPRGPLVQLIGINLQLINDAGNTDSVNGLGNLIIGYDETRAYGSYVCSNGLYTEQQACVDSGNTWALVHKSGSHNLILGKENSYSAFAGLIAGRGNTINADYATVTGGSNNSALSYGASVGGGYYNSAAAEYSSVSGGFTNIASGSYSSISGGSSNSATGANDSVSGGYKNVASGGSSSISGGASNKATGYVSSVNGGGSNEAANTAASVLGGSAQTSSSDYQTIPALP